jgi:hypothetical protein
MRTFELQYGFITTYHFTVFVWQAHFTGEGTQSTDSLYISRPIPHDQVYVPGQTVSVRQIMWYLMLKANGAERDWKMTYHSATSNTPQLRSAQKSTNLGGNAPPQKGSGAGSGLGKTSGLGSGKENKKAHSVESADRGHSKKSTSDARDGRKDRSGKSTSGAAKGSHTLPERSGKSTDKPKRQR